MKTTERDLVARLSPEGREELAFALILLKDFKSGSKWDPETTLYVRRLADGLGIAAEYDKLLGLMPVMVIQQRDP